MESMQWYNEPPQWEMDGRSLVVTTGAKTDFWRKTHYGFIRDDGHFYYTPIPGDFVARVVLKGQYRDLYDQAGLMLRVDQNHWLKCGVEFVEGVQQASVVVTRDYSDWSVMPLLQNPDALWLRLHRNADAVTVDVSLDGHTYTMLRLAYLTTAETLDVGLMCASPQGNGFPIRFEGFQIQPII